jgi:hypothetical protein
VPRRVTKQLVCPACGALVGEATYRRWPPGLTVVSADGTNLAPQTAGTQERRAQTAVAAAASPGEAQRARDRLDFVRRHFGELVFELRCPNGHTTLRTMPQLVRTVRTAAGGWVDLG